MHRSPRDRTTFTLRAHTHITVRLALAMAIALAMALNSKGGLELAKFQVPTTNL